MPGQFARTSRALRGMSEKGASLEAAARLAGAQRWGPTDLVRFHLSLASDHALSHGVLAIRRS
jgi:hypothetical protein